MLREAELSDSELTAPGPAKKRTACEGHARRALLDGFLAHATVWCTHGPMPKGDRQPRGPTVCYLERDLISRRSARRAALT